MTTSSTPLQSLGYTPSLARYLVEQNLTAFEPGRVVAEHKERYIVRTAAGDVEAEITGNLRFTAQSREDYPAVGDWVALMVYDGGSALIQAVLPRTSLMSRQAVGKYGERQVIAANIDVAFVVLAMDRYFSLNRLERYLSICYASKVTPVVVLTKTDLVTTDYLAERIATINARQVHIDVLAVSNTSRAGYSKLEAAMEPGKTYCLLGSSGVGKSTLTNNLCGGTLMKTNTISDSTGKGRHVTSHRELIVLPNGAILIDNPGMREVGVADAGQGLEQAFDTIAHYAQQCRYHDCTHRSEKGCAVLEALDNGDISMAAYENYLKIAQESAFFESTELERKKKDKQLGKLLKHYDKLNVKGKKNEDGGL